MPVVTHPKCLVQAQLQYLHSIISAVQFISEAGQRLDEILMTYSWSCLAVTLADSHKQTLIEVQATTTSSADNGKQFNSTKQ